MRVLAEAVEEHVQSVGSVHVSLCLIPLHLEGCDLFHSCKDQARIQVLHGNQPWCERLSVRPYRLKSGDCDARVRNMFLQLCLSESRNAALPIFPLCPHQCFKLVHLVHQGPNIPHDNRGKNKFIFLSPCSQYCTSSASPTSPFHLFTDLWSRLTDCN